MKTIKVSEAIGPVLDWLVAKCEGHKPHPFSEQECGQQHHRTLAQWIGIRVGPSGHDIFAPSIDWAQGGPIIEWENICLRGIKGGFHAWYHQRPPKTFGPTMLVAAMRCYVASKLGDTAEVPEELL